MAFLIPTAALLTLLAGTGGVRAPGPPAVGPDTACIVMDMPIAGRLSPLDSLTFSVQGHAVKICYGRPSSRGRTMLGGRDVPYGRLWRTGADEPTMIHATVPITVAGIEVDAGSYSLYTIPGRDEWVIVINRSITQWGHIARYNWKVKAQEAGRSTVRSEHLDQHVETLTFRVEPSNGNALLLLLEWERTRVPIPVAARSP